MSKKVIQFEETITTEIFDNETGKIKATEETKSSKIRVPREPDFIKLYIKDLCKLKDIPKNSNSILLELLNYTNYENEIYLNIGIKRRIVDKLDTTIQTLNNAISKLTKEEIIKRVDTGIFKLNPYLFGKGDWTNINKIRLNWEYNEDGVKTRIHIDNLQEKEDRELFNEIEEESANNPLYDNTDLSIENF